MLEPGRGAFAISAYPNPNKKTPPSAIFFVPGSGSCQRTDIGIITMIKFRTKSMMEILIHDARKLIQCPPCIDLSQMYARGVQSRHMRIIVLTQQAATSAAIVYAAIKNRLDENVVIYR